MHLRALRFTLFSKAQPLSDCLCPAAFALAAQSGHWFVIDSEYAREIGDLLPELLKVRCDWTNGCSAATDLYMVGQLLKDLPTHLCSDAELGELQRLLLSKGECFDKKLTAQQVLQDYEWLQQASATGSPHVAFMCLEHQSASTSHADGISRSHMHPAVHSGLHDQMPTCCGAELTSLLSHTP